MTEDNSNNSPTYFDVVPSNNADNFLLQDNAFLLGLESLK